MKDQRFTYLVGYDSLLYQFYYAQSFYAYAKERIQISRLGRFIHDWRKDRTRSLAQSVGTERISNPKIIATTGWRTDDLVGAIKSALSREYDSAPTQSGYKLIPKGSAKYI